MTGKNKALTFILAALFAAILMVPFITQRATINQLRTENTSLSARIRELTRELTNAVQTRTNAALDTSSALSRNQLNELMRLRAEITALRQQGNNPTLAATSRTARTNRTPALPDVSIPAPSNTAPNPAADPAAAGQVAITPRNAGYAQPTDAASTFLFSAQQGSADTLMASMTPEAQAELQARIAAGTTTAQALQQQLQSTPALRPSPNHPSTD
ncbi:MAG TPA: hypothetical protein VF773_04095, partial [Verrucomicrobiae bacterium]